MEAPPPDQDPPGGFTAFPPPPPGGVPPPPPPPPPAAAGQWQAPPNPYQYMMDTPAVVAQGYGYAPQPYVQVSYAGFWVRTVAYIIDSVIISIISAVLAFVLGFIAAIANPNAVVDSRSATVNTAWYLVSFVIDFAYYAGQWTLNDATFGQRIVGIRVLDADTFQSMGPGKALLRWIGLRISFLFCFLGVIWVAFDSRKQGWMDKMAGTVVVRG